MKNKPIILKLGGSVITIKNKPLTPNMPTIKRLAKEIAGSRISQLILVHGGGSYGHPIAAEYKIAEGFRERDQIIGFSKTHNAMVSLNMLIIEALINEGLPSISMAPSSFIVTRHGRIQDFHRGPLEQALKLGFIPVLYGDAVFDYETGFAILSGDQLVSRLAVEFNARRIIIGVDVNGLYTADPKTNENAKLIPCATLSDLKSFIGGISGSKSTDVTGGMMGKIFELILPVMNGVEVFIVNALKPGNVYKALKGEETVGTRIIRG